MIFQTSIYKGNYELCRIVDLFNDDVSSVGSKEALPH